MAWIGHYLLQKKSFFYWAHANESGVFAFFFTEILMNSHMSWESRTYSKEQKYNDKVFNTFHYKSISIYALLKYFSLKMHQIDCWMDKNANTSSDIEAPQPVSLIGMLNELIDTRDGFKVIPNLANNEIIEYIISISTISLS